jgi:aryl-alcohol dehydrogenase-like predicted oxidoreductase
VVLASKVGFKAGDTPDDIGLSRAAILRAIDLSLARLQTDYLDLYYLHVPDGNVPIEESLEAMDRLVLAGKVRYPAISNYPGWQVVEIDWLCQRHGYQAPHVSQPMYNLLARGIEQEYQAMCRRYLKWPPSSIIHWPAGCSPASTSPSGRFPEPVSTPTSCISTATGTRRILRPSTS